MKKYYALFTVFLFLSCGDPQKLTTFAKKASGLDLELIKVEEIILEESLSGIFPIEISSFQRVENDLFVLDIRSQQAFWYSASGELVKLIGGPGQGPGEYRLPGGLCKLENRIHVSSAGKIYTIYDQEGLFLRKINNIHPGGIPNRIYPGPNNTAFFTVYSRYSPEASIYKVNNDGNVIVKFSPVDDKFIMLWDQVHPMGNVVALDKGIGQIFIHKYEVIVFDWNGKEIDRINLGSNIYKAPDFEKAESLSKNGGPFRKFLKEHTIVSGFFKVGDNFATVLSNTNLGQDKDVIEFWTNEFVGIGRYVVSNNEKVVGSFESSLVFYNGDLKSIILREMKK